MKEERRRFGAGTRRLGRPPKLARRLPSIRRKDLPTVNLPKQSRRSGGKTKLTNHRAAVILHAIGSGCYRETAAELAGIKAETLSHWMSWAGEPYETFQRLVRRAEADLEARMVSCLTSQADVRPELALAILERKFPQRWAKVSMVATNSPPIPNINLGTLLELVERSRAEREGRLPLSPPSTIIDGQPGPDIQPRDPRPPKPVPLQLVPTAGADNSRPA